MAVKRNTITLQAINQFRPNPTGNLKQDIANRQTFDLIQNLFATATPAGLFVKGSGSPITIPVSGSNSDPGTGYGLQLQFNRTGIWHVTAVASVVVAGDTDQFLLSLRVGSQRQPYEGVAQSATDGIIVITQVWNITSTSGAELVTPMIKKLSGGGTSQVNPINSTLTASWQGA